MDLYWYEHEGVIVVRFRPAEITDLDQIQNIGTDLMAACAAAEHTGKMLVDFSGVQFMSSAMMGKLVLLNKKAKASSVEMRFCNVSPNVLEVFKITRLNKVFHIMRKPVPFARKAGADPRTPFDEPFSHYLRTRNMAWTAARRSVVTIVAGLPLTFTVDDVVTSGIELLTRETVCKVLFELWDAGLLEQSSRNGRSLYTKRSPG